MEEEEFEYLNDVIDKMIENNCFIRQKKFRFKSEMIDKTIKLSTIERYNFSDEELEYVMNYLKDNDIYVLGSSPALYTSFENYIYVLKKGVPQKTNILTKKESLDLLKKYKETHDIRDRNKLVESYIGLVNYITSKYVNTTGIDYYELASYGYEGLIVSIENLDLSKFGISSYIYNTINGYILNGIAQEQGFAFNDQFYLNYVKARKKVLSQHEEENVSEYDLLEEILDETSKLQKYIPEKSKNKFYEAYSMSLDDLNIEDSSNEIDAFIESEFQEVLRKNVRKSLEILSPVQKQYIMLRFGFDNDIPLTLEEVAKKFNISINGVYLPVTRGIKKIRNNKKIFTLLEELNNENNHEYDFNSVRGVSYNKK